MLSLRSANIPKEGIIRALVTAEEEAMTATAVIAVRMTGEGMTTGNNSWLKN
jgi:hypothetical protein